MRLLTDDGPVSVRSSWPLKGLDRERTEAQSSTRVKLVDSINGAIRRASYADLYRGNPWVEAAVSRNADSLARLPLKVYELNGDGDRERVRGDLPVQGAPSAAAQLDSILRRPNRDLSGFRLRHLVHTDLGIYGNGLIVKGRDAKNRVDALYHVPWARVSVILGKDRPIVGFEVQGTAGQKRTIHPEDAVHFRLGSDPESALGLSPLEPLADSAGLMDAIRRFTLAYFRNQARPSGNLKLPPGADERVLEYVKDQVYEMYASPENAGVPMVTTGDWQALSDEPQHTEALNLYKLSRSEVASVTGVPEPLLGALDKATLSNVEALKSWYYRDVVGPRAEGFEADLDTSLLAPHPSWRRLLVEHDLGAMLKPDLKGRAEAYRSMRYVHTTNELRRLENLPPIGDDRADTVWLPGAEVPLIEETYPTEPQETPADPEPNPEGSKGPGGDPADEPDAGYL